MQVLSRTDLYVFNSSIKSSSPDIRWPHLFLFKVISITDIKLPVKSDIILYTLSRQVRSMFPTILIHGYDQQPTARVISFTSILYKL